MSDVTPAPAVRDAKVVIDLSSTGFRAAIDGQAANAVNELTNPLSWGNEGFMFPITVDGNPTEAEIIDLDIHDVTVRAYLRTSSGGYLKVVDQDVTPGILDATSEMTVEELDAAFTAFNPKAADGC